MDWCLNLKWWRDIKFQSGLNLVQKSDHGDEGTYRVTQSIIFSEKMFARSSILEAETWLSTWTSFTNLHIWSSNCLKHDLHMFFIIEGKFPLSGRFHNKFTGGTHDYSGFSVWRMGEAAKQWQLKQKRNGSGSGVSWKIRVDLSYYGSEYALKAWMCSKGGMCRGKPVRKIWIVQSSQNKDLGEDGLEEKSTKMWWWLWFSMWKDRGLQYFPAEYNSENETLGTNPKVGLNWRHEPFVATASEIQWKKVILRL